MNEQQSILSLSWDQIKESPGFSEANEEQKAAAINQYHAQIAQYLKDNGASDQRLEAVEANRRARLYEVVPLLKQPEDIGVLENTVNAFTKSLGSFRENIFFNLAEQNPEEAQRFHRNLERQNPTYPGFSETVGRITGQMIPAGAALLAAPYTAGTSLSAISAIAVGSFYGASAAGGALGDIYAYEQATGEDVSSGKTAAVMAGHAAFEIGMEMVGLRTLTGIARRAGAGIGTDAAAELGNSILRRMKSETATKMADAVTDYFTHNKAARLALGWVGMGATEGTEEGATQIGQNVTDKLYREQDTLDGVMQSMGEGTLGGLLLGPLAIGVQMNAESGYHARVAAQGEGVLESAYLNLARKQAGADGSITEARDRIRSEYGEVDADLMRDPDFLFLKEYRGMAGVELVPVKNGSKQARGAQLTKEDGTPVVLVNADYVKRQRGSLGFIDSHEFVHAIGLDNAIRIGLDVAGKLPGFESYKQRLQQVYATNQLGTISDTTAANELVADVIGVVANRPDFLGTLIDSVSANPEVARTTVTKLRDMRGRLEKMGRRVDAWLTTPENDKYTGLPRAAMQAAQGKINAETVALDAMIGQFTAGFEKALAQTEQPAEGAQIVGGAGEPEDVLADLEDPPFSPAEGMTPEQVFEKGYSPKRGDFLDNPFGKALRQAWEENKGTSYVLKTLFLDRNIRIVPPGYGKTATRDLYDPNSMDEGAVQQESPTASQRERLAEYRNLPDWMKLKKNENPAKYVRVEWTADGVGYSDLLGTSGYGGEDTALGFIREQGLAPEGLTDASLGGNFMNEETRSVDEDQLMEKLTSLVQGVPSKAALRQQVEKMMREETKDAARSIASLKTYNDIQARRIDKRTMLKIAQTPALVDKLVNEPKLNTVQRLVSRDDLQPGIVVRQADNLYAVRSIAPDRVPEMVNLRGGRAFDYTEVAVDDPMADPDMAKDYRFGMELPPVVPYYGVQAAFPASASVEVQDMIDDLPAEDSVPFSPAEHGTPHIFAPEPGFPHGRFRLDKMGTGEGAQVYGWGIYFAENPLVAKKYSQIERNPTLAEIKAYYQPGHIVRGYGGYDRVVGFDEVDGGWSVRVIRVDSAGNPEPGARERAHSTPPHIADVAMVLKQPTHSIYRLDIPDDALPRLLDWDKPLSEQSDLVGDGLDLEVVTETEPSDSKWLMNLNGETIAGYQTKEEATSDKDGMTGARLYKLMSAYHGDYLASAMLRKARIPGLKFLDQFSRPENIAIRRRMGATPDDVWFEAEGLAGTFKTRDDAIKAFEAAQTRNYVIWDQSVLDRITLLERNGKPLDKVLAAEEQTPLSPAEGMTPIDSFLAPKGSLMRETYDMKAKAAEAHRILNLNGASTFAQKAANLGKADTAEAGVASMARNILFEEAQVMLANPDQGRRERFFGTSDEELMKAKAIEIADERHIFYSETGVELVSAQFDANGNHLPPTEQRRFGDWMEWISHTFGMAGQRDVKKMNLTKEKVEKADAVRDAMDDLIADLANLPKAEFEPALQSRVARIRKEAVRVQLQRIKDGVPLSAADEGKAGDILDRVFADPGAYYRRLKSKAGSDFRNELERELGAGAADLVAEQLEAHIAMFPDLAGKPKRAPTVTEEAEIDLINEMLKGHEKKLEALKASIYTGEVGQFITENFRARLPQLNLRLAALSASMTPEEQAAEIDKAFREIAKTILEEKKKERGGAALVQQGLLSVEGIEASLAEAKEAVKARQVAFTAIAPAVNMALRNASVSIADLLKVSQQKVGRIQFNLGQQIAGKVTEELLKMPELAEFPEAIDAAAQKVADSVEAYIAKRLEDSVDTIGNESMSRWNKIDRAARGLVRPLLDLFYGPVQGPKPYAETAKGTAAALLAEPALFRARVEAALAEQKAKGDLLENDVLGEMARGLGLPANATWDQIATTLTAKPIPDALARRVIAEHMAQTGGSILELADVLNPTADSAFERVVDDLTREFGEGTRALWRDALTKQVEARRVIIAKRILSKRKAKGQKVNAYDKMIRAIAGGMFDDETMALALAESVGLPELTQETRDALRPLLAAEVAALRAYGPDDPITHRATDAISGLLARELIKSWPKKGWFSFTKLDEQRLKSAFYSGALSGFRTWAVTNPASSWSKTFRTILETAAKNALLDPVLKKQGLQGVAAALSHMIRTMSLDASRLALREGIAPRSIERGPYLDAKVPESGLWDTDANANVVHKTLFSMWGLAAKYVRRAIMAGDASPYQSGFSFGSYEAARKIVLMEAEAAGETLSLAETQRRVYDKLALGPDGKPTAAQMEQAKAELDRSGSTYSDAEVRLRAESIARRSRPDYVNAAGRFLGEQGTFTNDVGVHYAQVEGMPGEPGLGQRLLNWVNSAKNSSNPAVALLTTAVVPFPGIASRIIDQSMNYLALPGYFRWRALNGLAETAETPAHRAAYAEAAGLQMVRMVEGTIALAVMALLVAMQDEDDPWLQITGAGPADFRKNYQWREAGNRPMNVSLKFFGKTISGDYRWSPLASLLFAVGTWQDQKLEDPDDRKGLVTAAAMGFMTSTFNQSFMSSVADLLDVISGRDEQGAQQKLFSLVGNPVSSIVIPFSGAVRTVEQAFFPYPNAARVEDNFFKTFAKTTIARTPIMNELLPRKMNALGRAIETDRPFEADVSWKGWRRGGDEDANKVFDYVVEKQAWLPTPNALRTHVLPPESDMTKGEARRLADKDDALMTYAEYEKFMQRRGDIAIALFQKHEALLRTLPEGEAAREVMSELMSLASTQAKREAVGLRPFKPGIQPDRVIRSAVKRAAAE